MSRTTPVVTEIITIFTGPWPSSTDTGISSSVSLLSTVPLPSSTDTGVLSSVSLVSTSCVQENGTTSTCDSGRLEKSGGLSSNAVVAIILGSLFVAVSLVSYCFFLCLRYRKDRRVRQKGKITSPIVLQQYLIAELSRLLSLGFRAFGLGRGTYGQETKQHAKHLDRQDSESDIVIRRSGGVNGSPPLEEHGLHRQRAPERASPSVQERRREMPPRSRRETRVLESVVEGFPPIKVKEIRDTSIGAAYARDSPGPSSPTLPGGRVNSPPRVQRERSYEQSPRDTHSPKHRRRRAQVIRQPSPRSTSPIIVLERSPGSPTIITEKIPTRHTDRRESRYSDEGYSSEPGNSNERPAKDRALGSEVESLVQKRVVAEQSCQKREVELPVEKRRIKSRKRDRTIESEAERPLRDGATERDVERPARERASTLPLAEKLIRRPLDEIKRHCRWDLSHIKYSNEDEVPLRLVNRLGHGSAAVVEEVRARDLSGSTFVRKGILIRGYQSQRTRERIEEEVRALKRVEHAHTMKLLGTYEVGQMQHTTMYNMLMFPAGEDLLKLLDSLEPSVSPAPPNQRRERGWLRKWFICLALPLSHIRAQGVIHQDIKPENMIHVGGEILITDFGSARILEDGQRTSTIDSTRHTWRYAAPEIVHKHDDLNAIGRHGTKSDVFSLGCVFLEFLLILAGRSLHDFYVYCVNDDTQLVRMGEQQEISSDELRKKLIYCHVLSRIDMYFESDTLEGHIPLFYQDVVRPMLEQTRQDRPAAQEVVAKVLEQSVVDSHCRC